MRLSLSTLMLMSFLTLNLSTPLYSYAAADGDMMMEDDELGIDFSDEPAPVVKKDEDNEYNFSFRGFLDTRWGTRFGHDDSFNRQTSLAETRLQGHSKFSVSDFKFNIKADLVYDDVIDGARVDVREAYVELPANSYAQVRIGRQNIMWGLGDLMVANDVFPKDFMGLYYGRDAEAEYMVTSSDGIRASVFLPDSTLDLVYVQYTPWAIPTGERFSFFNPFLQKTTGEDHVLNIEENHRGAFMARWSGEVMGQEFALYYNRSRWQSPDAFYPETGQLYYPRLNTYGFSIRGEAGPGIVSLDAAYYDSVEDKAGDKFWVRNSELRFILGYEFELAQDLTASFQWYQEQHQDQDAYEASLPQGMEVEPRLYDMVSMRLNQFLLSQKMTLSLFWFYSPTDNDGYLRLNMFHKFDDHWMINIGTNHFNGGVNDRFGQLEQNSNYFAAIRYSF